MEYIIVHARLGGQKKVTRLVCVCMAVQENDKSAGQRFRVGAEGNGSKRQVWRQVCNVVLA